MPLAIYSLYIGLNGYNVNLHKSNDCRNIIIYVLLIVSRLLSFYYMFNVMLNFNRTKLDKVSKVIGLHGTDVPCLSTYLPVSSDR